MSSARKVTSHNRVLAMRLVQRPSCVFCAGAKETGRELVLHLFDALLIGFAEEKPDHSIGKDPFDERIDDFPESKLSAEPVKMTFHRLSLMMTVNCLVYIIPN